MPEDRPEFSPLHPAIGAALGFGVMAPNPTSPNIGIGAAVALVITTAARLKYRRDLTRYYGRRLAQKDQAASDSN
ncbi:hypothetical protein [Streptomyces violascens]|uniref:hypothetical protein n=1 Tax=Streptomyces violascens TaxID=67381 RepID=UPI003696AA4E